MVREHSKRSAFPPPKYLLLPAIGVDISDRSIKYAELIPRSGGQRLGRHGEVPLPPNIVEGGRIIDSTKLSQILSELGKKEHFVFVRAALPEEQLYFFRTRVPEGTNTAIRDAIELSLEEHVPIPAMDAIFDFEPVAKVGTEVEVSVTAAAAQVVESYADTFSMAGLTLLSLELEAKAIARAVAHSNDAVTRMIVDFGETRTGIAIVSEGHVLFTSTLAVGGQMLTETLAKHFNVSFAEAESMKREFGLKRGSPRQDLFSLLLNNISVLRDEINKHLLYWHTHMDEMGKQRPEIEEIVLVGGDSNLAGLGDYLAATLHIKAHIADVWANVDLPSRAVPELTHNDSLGYATAIGLALTTHDYE